MTDDPKFVPIRELSTVCAKLRAESKRIVHCHGTFDLLHPGHIRHLQAAKGMGDVLVVTVTEDRFIRKGPGRPAFDQQLRAESLAALTAVDFVATAPWPTGVEAIELLRPDVYCKGQDYRTIEGDVTGGFAAERRAVEAIGGRVAFTNELQFSSSKLLATHFGQLHT